ncbi:Glycerol kinase [compost metagenome]
MIHETTALGAACLAGLAIGYWKSTDELRKRVRVETSFAPNMDESIRAGLYEGWKKAVNATMAYK